MNTPYRTILIVACSLALSGASLFASVNDFARSTGLTIAESRIVHGGWSAGESTDYCYLAALGDGNLYPDLDEALLAYTQYAGDSLGFRGQATVSSTNAVAGRTFAMADPGEAALLRSVAEPSLTCEAEAVGIRGLLQ